MKRIYYHLWLCLSLLLFLTPAAHGQEEPGQSYVIQLNDNLWKLAEKYLGDGSAYPGIVAATAEQAARDPSFSPISNPDLIFPGQKIAIPSDQAPVSAAPPAPQATATTEPAAAALPAATSATTTSASGEPGGHVAFSFWNDHGNRCTYEVNIISVADCLRGPEPCQASRRIMTLNNISEPAFSPDGSRLAFRSWGQPPSEASPYLQCAPAHPFRYLGHTSLDGSGFTGTGGFWEDSHPDWSPDGQRLLFDSSKLGDDRTRIYTIDAAGQNEQSMLIIGQHPSWAPDSQRFVYRGCDLSGNRCGLWLAQAFEPPSWETGSNMLGPVIETDQAAHPDWSPARDEIVYQRNEGGNWNLWLVDVDSGNDRQLTAGPGLEGLPSWSPDGEWVVYLTHDGQNWALRIVSRAGDDDRPLFTYDGGLYAVPYPVEPYGHRDWLDEQLSWGP